MEEPNTTPVRETEAVLEAVLTENPQAAEQSESAREEVPVKEHYASDEYADLFGGVRFDTTADIPIPASLIDQVIGQEHAVDVIKKAATQRRHVMMIGSPGTGKSMLAKAMSELLPKEDMQDIMVYPNQEDNNNPIIRVVPA
ncbi:MAG TPA: ATP-binding protein, partial [Methanocorpusculum sp.]|nr:ATP-binding protein [Methanocorpusculum sp.]